MITDTPGYADEIPSQQSAATSRKGWARRKKKQSPICALRVAWRAIQLA